MIKRFTKKYYYISAVVLILVIFLFLIPTLFKQHSDYPAAEIKHGAFRIELTATGEISAAQSINISAPRVRTNLQIVKLVDEGTVVDSGDFLLQFDVNELQKEIDDRQSELEIAQANLEKSQASMEANMAQLISSLENSEASYQLAKLRLEQMAFEADVKVQEEKLRLRQAEISYTQSQSKIESQKKMDTAELTMLELKIKQAKAELEKSKTQLAQMTVTAPAPGLVVYQKIWKGSGMEKIKIGDTPWRGQSLIQLPDLSKMEVISEISEVEIGQIEKGQSVSIKLDAFPDPEFTGVVGDVASLAHEKEGQSEIKVFDVVVDINEMDPLLKPGMTAKAKILVKEIPDQTYVPIEAVFDKDNKKVVYVLNGGVKTVEVVPKERNENFVVVEGELEAGQSVSLVDPQRPVKGEISKDRNSSPELINNSN